jgi:hypothetical protein
MAVINIEISRRGLTWQVLQNGLRAIAIFTLFDCIPV